MDNKNIHLTNVNSSGRDFLENVLQLQNTTITRGRYQCPCGIRTHNLSRRAAAKLRLLPSARLKRPAITLVT